jgi:hypothetical protein
VVMTTDLKNLKASVTLLKDAAFQAGKAQGLDMRHREHFEGLYDEANSAFLDELIELLQGAE